MKKMGFLIEPQKVMGNGGLQNTNINLKPCLVKPSHTIEEHIQMPVMMRLSPLLKQKEKEDIVEVKKIHFFLLLKLGKVVLIILQSLLTRS
uniref:Alternative protein ARHGAP5 n=1 Tax=Homo sapiens TaxID=9606 RepID=L8E796_HUMAN|nr:alternative protein ARHGAP5 [Homo sapiens]